MPCFTYLTDYEIALYSKVEDKELNELYQEIRKIDKDWLLSESKETIGFFQKKEITIYRLYYNFGNEVQAINFNSELGYTENKNMIMNYFYGYLNGYKKGMNNDR
jgi:hypothetical protein